MQEERVGKGETGNGGLPKWEQKGTVAECWSGMKRIVAHELDDWH
jgi:hypothetical protein